MKKAKPRLSTDRIMSYKKTLCLLHRLLARSLTRLLVRSFVVNPHCPHKYENTCAQSTITASSGTVPFELTGVAVDTQ